MIKGALTILVNYNQFGLFINIMVGIPTSHVGVPDFETLLCSALNSCYEHTGRQQAVALLVKYVPPSLETLIEVLSFWLWPEPADKSSLYLPLSASQI